MRDMEESLLTNFFRVIQVAEKIHRNTHDIRTALILRMWKKINKSQIIKKKMKSEKAHSYIFYFRKACFF